MWKSYVWDVSIWSPKFIEFINGTSAPSPPSARIIFGLIQLWNINRALVFWISSEHCEKKTIIPRVSLHQMLRLPALSPAQIRTHQNTEAVRLCPKTEQITYKNKIIVTTILRFGSINFWCKINYYALQNGEKQNRSLSYWRNTRNDTMRCALWWECWERRKMKVIDKLRR